MAPVSGASVMGISDVRKQLKALSTLATIVAEFGDYSRQCGQGLTVTSAGIVSQ